MKLVLIGVQSNGSSKPVPLNRPRTVIGRQTDCHLRIPANEVSRNHCEILIGDEGAEIADMGARNGTYVNGSKIDRRELKAGDLICVGPAVFVVQLDGEPDSGDLDASTLYREGRVDSQRAGGGGGSVTAADDVRTSDGGLLGDLKTGDFDPDDSSVVEFEFDLDEDEDDDDQPPL